MRGVEGVEFASHPLAYRYGGVGALADAALAARIRALAMVVEQLTRQVEENNQRRQRGHGDLMARRLQLMSMLGV